MSNWKIGDKAVCVNPNRIFEKGRIYTVSGIVNCCTVQLGMEEAPFHDPNGRCYCNVCGYPHITSDQSWYALASRFRKLSDVSAELSEEILEKIKVTEEEPIEV